MTGRERTARLLRHEPVDRVGLFEVFWVETARRWAREGHFAAGGGRTDPAAQANASADTTRSIPIVEQAEDHFRLELRRCRALNLVADLDVGEVIVEENATTRVVRDGNGALLRWRKDASGAPEHIDFRVKDRAGWEEHIRPRLLDRSLFERRIDREYYRRMRTKCDAENLFLTLGAVGAFDLMVPMCGHQHVLLGTMDDPAWVQEMGDVYSRLTVELLDELVAAEGAPDGLWVWDDLGYRNRPFMSPAMYRELIMPAHRRLFAWAHDRGLPVILHSDGFVEPLIPSLIEAGIDCLQPLEVKAGMDLLRLKRQYGRQLAFIGGMDARVLVTNDREQVRRELETKLPHAMAGSGYILQVDHSVPDQVDYETYRYFVDKGLEIGTYTEAP
jgi:uroporphyrinogen decarboxylase